VDHIVGDWNLYFNRNIPKALEKFKRDLLQEVVNFHESFQQKMAKFGIAPNRIEAVLGKDIRKHFPGLLKSDKRLKKLTNDLQCEMSRQIVPKIQDEMDPGYTAAAAQTGKGSAKRMKQQFHSHVEDQKLKMYQQATALLINDFLDKFLPTIKSTLLELQIGTLEDILVLFATFFESKLMKENEGSMISPVVHKSIVSTIKSLEADLTEKQILEHKIEKFRQKRKSLPMPRLEVDPSTSRKRSLEPVLEERPAKRRKSSENVFPKEVEKAKETYSRKRKRRSSQNDDGGAPKRRSLNPAKKVSLGPSVQSFPAQNIKLERESPPREVVQDSSENSKSQNVKAEENFSENPRQNVHRASSWNELQDHINSDASLEPSETEPAKSDPEDVWKPEHLTQESVTKSDPDDVWKPESQEVSEEEENEFSDKNSNASTPPPVPSGRMRKLRSPIQKLGSDSDSDEDMGLETKQHSERELDNLMGDVGSQDANIEDATNQFSENETKEASEDDQESEEESSDHSDQESEEASVDRASLEKHDENLQEKEEIDDLMGANIEPPEQVESSEPREADSEKQNNNFEDTSNQGGFWSFFGMLGRK